MTSLEDLLTLSAQRHDHLCPRQVLGVRMGMLAARLLQVDLPQRDKRVLTIVETDGCTADGVEVATGCSVGHRTLRVEDFGKVAATVVDTGQNRAVRIHPRQQARALAANFAPKGLDRWHAQLIGYQRMPAELLLAWAPVELTIPTEKIVSRPGARAVCDWCQEEINNEREVVRDGITLCRACAGEAYYRTSGEDACWAQLVARKGSSLPSDDLRWIADG